MFIIQVCWLDYTFTWKFHFELFKLLWASYKLKTSSNIMSLKCRQAENSRVHIGATVSRQLITTCVCANLSNKCSSQFRVLFRVQQHITKILILPHLAVYHLTVNFQADGVRAPHVGSIHRRLLLHPSCLLLDPGMS